MFGNRIKPGIKLTQDVATYIRVEVCNFIQIYRSLDSFALTEK